MAATETANLVIIGAGVHGLAMAKTYIEVHPKTKVVLLDGADTLGGVWAKHRLYPGLNSNNMLGTYEFSDFPMDGKSLGVKSGEHIPGHVIHEYLFQYAKRYGVFDKIRFNINVETAEAKGDEGWLLTLSNMKDSSFPQKNSLLLAQKLVVATGMNSDPFTPEFVGSASFGAPIFHSRDFLQYESTLRTAKTVVVYGGSKSSWDACYAYATAGVEVHMVIRESGNGPTWVAPPYVTPLKKWLEKLVQTRLLTWFSPCAWGHADGYPGVRNFLHGSTLGRAITKAFWGLMASDVEAQNGYDNHPDTKKLKPWYHAFWAGTSLSILNYPTDFFQLVRTGKVKVHIADITKLSSKTVHLSDNTTIPTSALLCATGWKHHPAIKFLPKESDPGLGLPYYSPHPLEKDPLTKEVDQEILARFPHIDDQQPPRSTPSKGFSKGSSAAEETDDLSPRSPRTPNRPFRLYRFMVPPAHVGNRNIAFAGMMMSIATTISAQTQALWLCAYFDGQLPICSYFDSGSSSAMLQALVERETELHCRYCRLRNRGGSDLVPDIVFDTLPYVDLLLGDLGLRKHRKHGITAEWLEPYGPEDYKGLVDEWKTTHSKILEDH